MAMVTMMVTSCKLFIDTSNNTRRGRSYPDNRYFRILTAFRSASWKYGK